MLTPPTRTLLGICLAVGGSFTVMASFNFVFTPMLTDLGLSQQEASIALSIPPIASLLVVFLAGRLGGAIGHRRVMTWMIVGFIVGSAIVAAAEGLAMVVIGLLLEGIAATAIQIIGLGLLSDRFPDPKRRAAAFATFGMVSPLVWLAMPVATGVVVGGSSWRWIPVSWVLIGMVMFAATRFFLPNATSRQPLGDVWTPIVAGATVAAAVQTLNRIGDEGVIAPITVVSLLVTIGLAVLCGLLMRRIPSPAFSVRPLRISRSRAFLVVVLIIPLLNTVFLMTMAFQYLYGLTVLQTALVMVPAQLAAVLGTKLIAGPMMRRLGVPRTAAALFAALALTMPLAFLVTPTSSIWVAVGYVSAFNMLTVAASITVTSGVLNSTSAVDSGQLSAYRGSAQALGAVLAVVVMNPIVFAVGRMFLGTQLERAGLSEQEAATLADQIRGDATSPDVMAQYALPLPSGGDISGVMAESIAAGIHVNGVLGCLLALMCVVLMIRNRPSRSQGAESVHS